MKEVKIDRVRFRGHEQKEYIDFCGAYAIVQNSHLLPGRLASLPQGKRHLGMLLYTLKQIALLLEASMPEDQLEHLKANLQGMKYKVGIPNITDNDLLNYGRWLNMGDLGVLTMAAADHCMACDLTPETKKNCPLRKVMHKLPANKTMCDLSGDILAWERNNKEEK